MPIIKGNSNDWLYLRIGRSSHDYLFSLYIDFWFHFLFKVQGYLVPTTYLPRNAKFFHIFTNLS